MLHDRISSRYFRHAQTAPGKSSLGSRVRASVWLTVGVVLIAGCGSSSESEPVDGAPADTLMLLDAGADGGAAMACGGAMGVTCKTDEYCDFPDDRCGSNDAVGSCQPRPLVCSPIYTPACGCDGVVHSNDCDVMSQGQDIAALGGCEAPEGYFACGGLFCATGVDYCERVVADVAGVADDYRCVAIPTPCKDNPDCECLASEPCGDSCTSDQGNITLTCPGG